MEKPPACLILSRGWLILCNLVCGNGAVVTRGTRTDRPDRWQTALFLIDSSLSRRDVEWSNLVR